MNQTEQDLKALAKAVGASLSRSGHAVPHSVVLQALSSALNKRNWQTVKAQLTKAPSQEGKPLPVYGEKTRFLVGLARLLGSPIEFTGKDEATVLADALNRISGKVDGTLRCSGWNVPAELNLVTSKLDAGDFRVESGSVGEFCICVIDDGKQRKSLTMEVGFDRNSWFVTQRGVQQAYAQVFEMDLHRKPPATKESVQASSLSVVKNLPVKAQFCTDDNSYEVDFDAQEYLAQASDRQLVSILKDNFSSSDALDDVALYMRDKKEHPELVEAFEYLENVYRSRMKNPPGFEVSLSPKQTLEWLRCNRPAVLAKFICQRYAVVVMQGNEGATVGLWDWFSSSHGEGSEHALDTEEAAYIEAMNALELYQEFCEENDVQM